jgi:hypothetical protein
VFSKTKSSLLILSLLTTYGYSGTTLAQTCYEKSPFLSALQEDYFNLDDTITLDKKQTAQLSTFFKKLDGNWHGSSVESQCKGPDRAPRIELSHAEIEAELTAHSDGNLTLSTDIDLTEKNIIRHQTLEILKDLALFDLTFESKNHVLFSERHRLATKFNSNQNITNVANLSSDPTVIKRSRHIETLYDIELRSSQLIFKRAYYSNGVFVGDEVWTLKKGR